LDAFNMPFSFFCLSLDLVFTTPVDPISPPYDIHPKLECPATAEQLGTSTLMYIMEHTLVRPHQRYTNKTSISCCSISCHPTLKQQSRRMFVYLWWRRRVLPPRPECLFY